MKGKSETLHQIINYFGQLKNPLNLLIKNRYFRSKFISKNLYNSNFII